MTMKTARFGRSCQASIRRAARCFSCKQPSVEELERDFFGEPVVACAAILDDFKGMELAYPKPGAKRRRELHLIRTRFEK